MTALNLFTASIIVVFSNPCFAKSVSLGNSSKVRSASLPSDTRGRQFSLGGTSGVGGGGNSVGTKNGRRLLDLAEEDQLQYFVPKTRYGNDPWVSAGMASLMTHTFSTGCSDLRESVRGMTNNRFLKVFMIAYGMDRLVNSKTQIEWCQPLVQAFFQYNKKGFSEEIRMDIQNGFLPQIQPLRWAFVDYDLETIEDSGIIRVENPKSKKQLAIQKDGLVVINKNEFEKIDGESQNALFVHEAALYAVIKLNPSLVKSFGTAPIRTYVRNLIRFFDNWAYNRNGKDIFPPEPVREAFDNLKISER